MVMVARSVLRSLLLAGRGLPEADLLWAVLVKEPLGCGEGPLRDSRCSALELCCPDVMRGLDEVGFASSLLLPLLRRSA